MLDNDQQHLKVISHSRPTLGNEEIELVSDVIGSSQIGQGEMVRKFEEAFAREMGVPHAVSTNSGTAALHLTLLAMGIGPEDEVIIPSYVCTALLNAINYVGAAPILAEIDSQTDNLDLHDVKKRLSEKTKAIIVPHMFGLAANIEGFLELDVPIIEDCAQAIGSLCNDQRVGTFGEAAIFSFYATKVMASGEGGMVISKSKHIADGVRDLREYDKKDDYKIRFNYKMTDVHAAIGLVQLSRLQEFIHQRRKIAQRYHQAFEAFDLQLPPKDPGHIFFRYILKIKKGSAPWISFFRKKGIECARPVNFPLHRYLNLKGFPITEAVWKKSLSIPIYPALTDPEVSRVIQAFLDAYRIADTFQYE